MERKIVSTIPNVSNTLNCKKSPSKWICTSHIDLLQTESCKIHHANDSYNWKIHNRVKPMAFEAALYGNICFCYLAFHKPKMVDHPTQFALKSWC